MNGQITFSFTTADEAAKIILAVDAARVATTAEVTPTLPPTPKKNTAPTASTKAEKPAKVVPETPPEPETDIFNEPEPAELTLDVVRELFQELVRAGRRDEAVVVLNNHKVARVPDIPNEKLVAIYNDVTALLKTGS